MAPNNKASGLYIHIPFCKSKCPYCGFYSIASISLVNRWLYALEKEVKIYKDRFDTFDTLYLGGGTPSCLDLSHIEKVMTLLFDHFMFSNDTEITIELNPGDITKAKASVLRDLGFNRVNLGVQSFNDRELKFLGRRHNSQQALEAFNILRSSGLTNSPGFNNTLGFSNIGIDLMYGIMGQSMDEWMKTLSKIVDLKPEHLSCYQLTIEKGTPFYRKIQEDEIKPIDEETEKAFFLATSDFLESNGYIHYEISNFAKGKHYRSRHNRKYWQHVPYLGLGPSAHSFQDNKRWWNKGSVRNYCNALEAGRSPVEESEELTPEQIRLEQIFLGLRTNIGFDKNILNNENDKKALANLREAGLVEIKNNRVLPTRQGFLVADSLPLYFK